MSVRILIGDCRERMSEMDDASVDSCVTDPPYHLTSIVKRFGAVDAAPAKTGKTGAYARASKGFMGQTWDGGDVAFNPATWEAVLRVLKPGAHLIAFSGTRTYHRMACAIEDAGFEIRDQLAWCYGSGFPKSHDVAKGFDRAADYKLQALVRRSAVEAVEAAGLKLPGNSRHDWTKGEHAPGGKWWAEFQRWLPDLTDEERERVEGEIVATVRKAAGWFTRGHIYDLRAPATPEAAKWQGWGTALKPAWEPICLARKPLQGTVAGNIAAHGTGAINIDGCRIGSETVGWGGARGGSDDPSQSQGRNYRMGAGEARPVEGRWPANIIHDGSEEVLTAFPDAPGQQGDLNATGRARPTKTCLGDMSPPLPHAAHLDRGSAARFFYCAKATTDERGEGNNHPTVKPVDLMRWLCRLVTPKGGTVLDPFMGSGSTLIAADAEQFNAIGCELSPDYAAIAERRIRDAAGMFAEVRAA